MGGRYPYCHCESVAGVYNPVAEHDAMEILVEVAQVVFLARSHGGFKARIYYEVWNNPIRPAAAPF